MIDAIMKERFVEGFGIIQTANLNKIEPLDLYKWIMSDPKPEDNWSKNLKDRWNKNVSSLRKYITN